MVLNAAQLCFNEDSTSVSFATCIHILIYYRSDLHIHLKTHLYVNWTFKMLYYFKNVSE